ncbi:MAG: ABC transporter ATP-binding protein [Lachnospiraceae bacterium]|nr:ABC transporter ATP-binding protein [Lachnospiraceae bacterium]
MADAFITVDNIGRTFTGENTVTALQEISFSLNKGEFLCIVGQSGCGKSTLLRIMSGVDPIHEGKVTINGKVVDKPDPSRGMVFQESRLLSWMTVSQNVGFALKEKEKEKRNQLIDEYVSLVGLADFRHSYPRELSGGMAQRVSIARALVNQPEVLFMDEPFGALDYMTKINMQNELLRIRGKNQMTIIFVTHDIDEAVYLSDTILILSKNPGKVKKVIQNTLPSPRNRNSEEFLEIKKQVYDCFFIQEGKEA